MSIKFAREFQICENSCRENQASKSLTLGEYKPMLMHQHRDTVKRFLMSQLLEQMGSQVAKLDKTILDGCFEVLDHFLVSFKLDDKEYLEKLYQALSDCCIYPKDKDRRYHQRSALNLFARHSAIWSQKVILPRHCEHWYSSLKVWAESPNSDVSASNTLKFLVFSVHSSIKAKSWK